MLSLSHLINSNRINQVSEKNKQLKDQLQTTLEEVKRLGDNNASFVKDRKGLIMDYVALSTILRVNAAFHLD